MELIIVAIIAALGAAYFVKRGSSTSSMTSSMIGAGSIQNGVILSAPHLLPNAQLLSDSSIAGMNLSIGFSSGDRARFLTQVLPCLQSEQVVSPDVTKECSSGGNYAGPPMALTGLKDGSLALSTTGSIGSAVGGGFGSASGIFGSGFAAAGTAAGTAIPIIGIAIGAAIQIFSTIAAHHAAAVKNEVGLTCQLVPPANQTLAVIEQAVMTGQITPKQGQAALAQLLIDFKTHAQNGQSGQLAESSGHCNALCWFYHYLSAVVMKKQNRYSQYVSN